MRVKAGTNPLA